MLKRFYSEGFDYRNVLLLEEKMLHDRGEGKGEAAAIGYEEKKKEIYAIIEKIEKDEKIKIDEKAKEAMFNISEGDARKVENILQSSAAISNNITEEIIYSMASVAKPKEVDEALKLALNNQFIDARNKLMDIMLNYGLSGLDIIKQIQKEILNLDIDNEKKMLLMEKCGEIEFRMTEGSDEFVQLETLLAAFVLASNK